MFRSIRNYINPIALMQNNRYLKIFNPVRPEIVIANNSGIFFSLASLKIHGKSSHPNLKVFLPKFWLDDVHSDYNNLNWGQTIQGIPWYARQEFLEIYPSQTNEALITWKQYKELRAYVIDKLKAANVDLFHGNPHITNLGINGYSIKLNENEMLVPANTFFYNVFRQPDVKHGFANAPEVSHTKIYSLAKDKIPRSIIIAGGGRSTIWLCHHFSSSLIACIKPANIPYTLFQGEIKPSNLITFDSEKVGEDKEIQIARNLNNGKDECILIDTKQPENDFLGQFYSAIGLKPNLNITDAVSKESLLIYPYFDKFDWLAPDIIPVGSLMESTLRWAVATENLNWAFETHSYHENYFMKMLTKHIEENGINLPMSFFDYLRDSMIKYFDLELNSNSKRIPTDEEAIKIYKDCYSFACDGNPNKVVLNKFETCIREVLEGRVKKYNESPSIVR